MQQLTQQERYRDKLFNAMQDKQLVDNLKVKVRQKLIEKLKHQRKAKDQEPEGLLVKRLCCSLFEQFLRKHSLDYSLSVFTPECGFSSSLFATTELCSILKIKQTNQKSILQEFVANALPRRSRGVYTVDTEQQTDDPASVQSIEFKLQCIEQSFKHKQLHHSNATLKMIQQREQRQVKYKNQLNKRYKEQLNAQLKRVREYECAIVRAEQRDRYTLMLKEYQEQFEDKYRQRLEALKNRQQQAIQKVADKMKQIQSFNHQTRQKVLRDFEALRLKQIQLKKFKQMLDQRQRSMPTVSKTKAG